MLLLLLVLWGLTKVFSRPWIGVYLWTWISLMNPHRLTWGIANSFPIAQSIAAVTVIGMLTGKQEKNNIWCRESVVLLMLILWIGVTTIFAINPDGAQEQFIKVVKIQMFIFITLALISDKQKLDGFIWVMAASIGFYGVKGGIFTILTGGSGRVWGPPGSFIGGNNEIALALLMTLPLLRYLQLQAENKWVKRALLASMFLCAVSILGTQSRGAFLGIMAIGLFFWWKSSQKLATTAMVAIVGAVIMFFMPQTWWDRMNTIQTYQEDGSAMGRINAWHVAVGAANERITGGGGNMFTREAFARYAPNPEDLHDVHSIYFEMIGEQGWIGFALFILLAFLTWRKAASLVKEYRNVPELKWVADLGSMIQVALIGYYVSGAFLGLAYFDYYYDLIATVIVTHIIAQKSRAELTTPPLTGQRKSRHYMKPNRI
jgi:probable O-glycosylation ligase (exosortase A-associated)